MARLLFPKGAKGKDVPADVFTTLLRHDGDVGALRPYVNEDGEDVVDIFNEDGELETVAANAAASLPKQVWLDIDQEVTEAIVLPMNYVNDLRGRGMETVLPDGMGNVVLESQMMGLMTPATISMNGLRQSEEDTTPFDLAGVPLPLIHKDFRLDLRTLLISKRSRAPLDLTNAREAARQVGLLAEQLALGLSSTYSYAGYTVYGLTNFPSRITSGMTLPTAGGWTPTVFINEIIGLVQLLINKGFTGPFKMYISLPWMQYLERDYNSTRGNSLRQRLAEVGKVGEIEIVWQLTGYQVILMNMDKSTARIVVGMDVTTVQWDGSGGFEKFYKIICMIVPQYKADIYGNCGIVHAVGA
jgi:uncharacterized linocin/CFP29 family protein